MNSMVSASTLQHDEVIFKEIIGQENYNKTISCTNFLIVLFIRGSGTHYVDSFAYPIRNKQLHFLFPGQVHHWQTGPETIARKIVVGKKLFDSFSRVAEFYFTQNNLGPIFALSDSLFDMVNQEMDRIQLDLLENETNGNWADIIALRIEILSSIIRKEAGIYLAQNPGNGQRDIIEAFCGLVDIHFKSQQRVAWYADHLNLSSNYLNTLCQNQLKTTASNVILQRKLREAKQQLRFSTQSIQSIGFDLGYETSAAFSTFFKKQTGDSPRVYRKQ